MREVWIRALQLGSAHCCSWVRMLGRAGVREEVVCCCDSVRLRAQAPAWGQEWEVSVRWSRQNLLFLECLFSGVFMGGVLKVWALTHPLQLSHRKGRKSSWWQKGIWQWAPMASTSPTDILL